MIYDCNLRPDKWAELLTTIEARLGAACSYLIIHDMNPGTGGFVEVAKHNIDEEANRGYNEYYARLNPLLPYLTSTTSGEVYATRHLVCEDAYLETPFYNEYAKPLGWFDYAGVNLRSGRDNASVIGFTSAGKGRAFDDSAIGLLRLLAPHLTRAAKIERMFVRERWLARGLAAILSSARFGALVVDTDARILIANAVAEDMLSKRDGISDEGGVLAAGKSTRELRDVLGATKNGGPSKSGSTTLQVKREGARRPLLLHVFPVSPAADPSMGFHATATAVVLICDPGQGSDGAVDVFGDVYRLSLAERQVLARLEAGDPPNRIAAFLGIEVATVRSHLHHIYDKTGTKGQVELMSLFHRSVPPLR